MGIELGELRGVDHVAVNRLVGTAADQLGGRVAVGLHLVVPGHQPAHAKRKHRNDQQTHKDPARRGKSCLLVARRVGCRLGAHRIASNAFLSWVRPSRLL